MEAIFQLGLRRLRHWRRIDLSMPLIKIVINLILLFLFY